MDTEDVDDANDTTSIIAESSQKAVQDPPNEGMTGRNLSAQYQAPQLGGDM